MARTRSSYRTKRRGYKNRSSSRRGRTKRRVAKVPRNLFRGEKTTTFTLTRTWNLKSTPDGEAPVNMGADVTITGRQGMISCVFAVGNVNILAPYTGNKATVTGEGADAVTTYDMTEASAPNIDKVRRAWTGHRALHDVFHVYKILKHEIYLIPVCGTSDTTKDSHRVTPVEECFTSYAADIGTSSITSARKIENYGLMSNSQIHAPTNNRMPYLVKRFYPSSGSRKDNQWLDIADSLKNTHPGDLQHTTGDENKGKTFGFWKIYADGLKPDEVYYRVIEKATIAVAQRRGRGAGIGNTSNMTEAQLQDAVLGTGTAAGGGSGTGT